MHRSTCSRGWPSYVRCRELSVIAMLSVMLTGCDDRLIGPSPGAVPTALQSSTAAPARTPVQSQEVIPDQYVVVLHDDASDVRGSAKQLIREAEGQELFTYTHAIRGFAAQFTAAKAEALRRNPQVKRVEQDAVIRTTVTQTNPVWGLDRIDQRQLPLGGTFSTDWTGQGVTVYILDTGIRYSHAEFGGRASLGADFIGGDGSDCHGHGTHVAGTAGGSNYGVAKSARLKSVRVLNCEGSAPFSTVIAGMDWVAANAAKPAVVNMSLGGGSSAIVNEAVAHLTASGVTVVVAAGNADKDACTFSPAGAPSAVTVGATANTDARATFSNKGSCVDVFAPGVGITSALHTGDNAAATWNGTSMAAPHVAGIAALLLSERPSWSPAQVDSVIHARSTKLVVTNAQSLNSHLAFSGQDDDNTPILPPQPITAPSDIAVSVVGEYLTDPITPKIRVSWRDNSSNEGGFEVWKDDVMLWRSLPNQSAYETYGIPYGTTVTFKVRAFGNDGGSSEFASATVTLPSQPALSPPAAPGEFTAAVVREGFPLPGWSEVKLTWRDNATDEAGFDLQGTNLTSGGTLGGGSPANTSLAYIAIYQGQWVLEIRARNSGGSSSWVSTQLCVSGPSYSCDPAQPAPPLPPPDSDPVAAFSANCRANKNNCAFDASESSSASGLTSYSWSFGDGSSETRSGSATTAHSYASKGDYTVTLTVTDTNGRSASTQKTVSIKSLGR